MLNPPLKYCLPNPARINKLKVSQVNMEWLLGVSVKLGLRAERDKVPKPSGPDLDHTSVGK
ncbi:hypothetical protein skT53_21280 [Effusibacillus dendaii]|uniref:Uncharacterized protein n=1 Tax=Effusibacillus dendaii TaxID=2743772 RepID=A0A7I8DAD0_9BACL|nr:hypothetical protein skT53_21280 [Effusibacillus dendaii]